MMKLKNLLEEITLLKKLFLLLYSFLGLASIGAGLFFLSKEAPFDYLGILYLILGVILLLFLFIQNYTPTIKKTKKHKYGTHLKDTNEIILPLALPVQSVPLAAIEKKSVEIRELSVPLTFTSEIINVGYRESDYQAVVERIIKDTCKHYSVNYTLIANKGIHAIFEMYEQYLGFFITKDVRLEVVATQTRKEKKIRVQILGKQVGELPASRIKFLLPYIERGLMPIVSAHLKGGPFKTYDRKRQMMAIQYSDFQIELLFQLEKMPL